MNCVIVLFVLLVSQSHSQELDLDITIGQCVLLYSRVCETDNVKFFLSSSDYPEEPAYLFEGDNYTFPDWASLGNDFKVIIHGYGGGVVSNQTRNIEQEYLKIYKTNIIFVDWGKLSAIPCYATAVINTKQAGKCISNFLLKLAKHNSNFCPTNVYIIGFSLGAHVAGITSNYLERAVGHVAARITGLDPALPLFASANSRWKLDKSDAVFVDVIHTNAGQFGKIEQCGHADFYVNGGQAQPFCTGRRNMPICSHFLAIEYFKESITSSVGFWGVRCSSYFQYIFGWCGRNSYIPNSDEALMGEYCPKSTRGLIFVYTNMDSPFAMGRREENRSS